MLAEMLVEHIDALVVLTGAPSEAPLAQAIERSTAAPLLNLVGATTLPELVALLAESDILVTGDSGPMHIACAVGTPVVVLHGPTDPDLSGPTAPDAIVLRRRLWCSPCYDASATAECRFGNPVCMKGIAPRTVFAATERQLRRHEYPAATPGRSASMSLQPPIPEAPPQPIQLPEHARILVVKLAALGDLLLTTPALRALRLRYPHARLDILTTEQSAPLLADSPLRGPCLRARQICIRLPSADPAPPLASVQLAPLLRTLRGQHYDAVILGHHLTLPFGRLKYRALLARLERPIASASIMAMGISSPAVCQIAASARATKRSTTSTLPPRSTPNYPLIARS